MLPAYDGRSVQVVTVAGSGSDDLAFDEVDRRALDEIFTLVYDELRQLARAVRRRDAYASISPTALVNEAWVKMADSAPSTTLSRLHFKRIAARAMRQVLVESARRRNAAKRGGGALPSTLEESLAAPSTPEHLLELDAALSELARLSPRQAAVVEARFFGGMEVVETAELLGVAEATVQRDWRAARAWLAGRLTEP